MLSLLRSKSDEDILHSASPLLLEQKASKHRGSLFETSSNTSIVQELKSRLSRIRNDDEDEEAEESSRDKSGGDTLSPVIKVTSCSPTTQRKQSRSSCEDVAALPKSITPVVKKRFIPKHRKARSLGSK